MTTTFRTVDVPVASRTDYWRHVVTELIGPLDLQPDQPDHRDELVVGDVGPVRVAELSSHRSTVATRTARVDTDLCKIDVVADGRVLVEQDGRTSRLAPGDFCLVDLSRPARWVSTGFRLVAVVFPRPLLPLRYQETAQLTAAGIQGGRGSGALVSTLALELADHLDQYDTTDTTRLGTAVLDLLTVSLTARLDRGYGQVAPDTRQRALLLRIQAFIEEHLGDPELSPALIAAAHHVSLRFLHKLFESQETTVAARIRQRRLDRSRRELLDPAAAHRPVSAVGARWGIPNAAHFSRAFKAAYGLPPGEYRRTGNGR